MKELLIALAKAQSEFPTVKRNKKSHQAKYADLATLVEHTRGPLTKNGLCHTFQIALDPDNGECTLITRLFHTSGESLDSSFPLGNLGKMRDQDAGKAISYAKRYSFKALVAVEEEDDPDDDGWGSQSKDSTRQGSQPSPKKIPGKYEGLRKPFPQDNQPQPPKPKAQSPNEEMKKELWKEMRLKKITAEEAKDLLTHTFQKNSTDDLTLDEFKFILELVKLKGRSLLDEMKEEKGEE